MNDATHLGAHRVICRDTFAAMLQKGGEMTPDLVIGKAAEADSEAPVELKGSSVTFVGTSSKLDRDNDVIAAAGVDFSNWEKRPVILASHDARQRIGLGTAIERRGARTIVTAEYYGADISPIAATMRSMLEFNIARKALKDVGAVYSIGFRSIKATWNDSRGGVDFKEIETLEFSDVSMAANPAAVLLEAKAAGVDFDPLMEWQTGVLLKDAGLVAVNLEFAKRCRDAIDPSKVLKLIELGPAHAAGLKWMEPREALPETTAGTITKTDPETGADPVALAYQLAALGHNADVTREIMRAAGMGDLAQGIKASVAIPAPAPAVPTEQKDPDPEQEYSLEDAVKDLDLQDIFANRVAAATGKLPIPSSTSQ